MDTRKDLQQLRRRNGKQKRSLLQFFRNTSQGFKHRYPYTRLSLVKSIFSHCDTSSLLNNSGELD